MKTFAVVITTRDTWDIPTINIIQAQFEDEAFGMAAELNGYTSEEFDEMESAGDFSVTIREVGVELPNIKVYDLPPGHEK
jgi:hypothetical protein